MAGRGQGNRVGHENIVIPLLGARTQVLERNTFLHSLIAMNWPLSLWRKWFLLDWSAEAKAQQACWFIISMRCAESAPFAICRADRIDRVAVRRDSVGKCQPDGRRQHATSIAQIVRTSQAIAFISWRESAVPLRMRFTDVRTVSNDKKPPHPWRTRRPIYRPFEGSIRSGH